MMSIKSDITDIKNLGGPYAGAIIAGKFLSHFIDFPWIHIDLSVFKIRVWVQRQGAQEWVFVYYMNSLNKQKNEN